MAESNQFAAAPKVVKPKKKYKQKQPEEQEEDQIKLIYNNLMWDKRVVRGNTYSALVTTSKNVEMPYANTSNQMKRTTKPEMEEPIQQGNRRANIQIYTDEHVETLTDKPPRYQYGAQTEFKMEKQVVRHRMPQKIGVDIETQIWDNELFDFDYEVQPLLSVLCARTLEISRMEVLQEEELSIMKLRQMELQLAAHQDQVVKVKNMYDKEEELQKQNAKRLENYRKQKQKKIQAHQRLFSRVIGKNYLRDLGKNAVSYVQAQGFFRKEIDNLLIQKFLPTLYETSIKEQEVSDKWKLQAQELLQAAKDLIVKEHKWSKEVERTRRNQILNKRAELAREKNERKLMKEEEKYMIKFLQEEKVYLEKLEEEKRKQEEAQNAQEQAS